MDSNSVNALTLCDAVQTGELHLVRAIVETGQNLNEPDLFDTMWHRCAVHYASHMGLQDILLYLLDNGAPVNITDGEGRTCLHWATPKVEILKLLIDRGATIDHKDLSGTTTLHVAATLGCLPACELLVKMGANINETDNSGWSAMHLCICSGHIDVAYFLLSLNCDANIKTANHDTTLHLAVDHQNFDLLNALLKHGTDLEAVSCYGYNALHIAVSHQKLKSVWYLLNVGINTTKCTNGGHSVMYLSALDHCNIRLTELLLQAGYNLQGEAWLRGTSAPYDVDPYMWFNLRCRSRHPFQLKMSCVATIRKYLFPPISVSCQMLPLPEAMKDLISLLYYLS